MSKQGRAVRTEVYTTRDVTRFTERRT